MDLVAMLSNVTDLDKYTHVTKFTNILCETEGFDVKSNNISILRVLENLHLMEVEYLNNYRKKGAVFILLERLAEIEPSTHWIHISKVLIRILRQWLTASSDLILKNGWMFVEHIMNIIYKIIKKCNNIVHLCEPIIVLILNSHLNSNQKHELGECLNRISNNLTKSQRSLVQPNLMKHFPDIAAMIGPCGHFPCQYSLLEILIRWLLDRNNPEARREAANVWFRANRFSTRAKQIFLERTWDNFPKDARDFLNAVNHDKKSVISVQITKVKMGDEIFIRSTWWLDINMATRSVSMMVPRKKLPLIREPAESYSVAFSLPEDNTDNATLQRIGYENIVTMSSIDYIQLSPMNKTTAWKTMIVSLTRHYVEILDKSLKQIFANKYKALISIDKGIYPSEGETTNYYSESDFSRFSEPEKQNSSFAALKKFATQNNSSEKVFSHAKPIETVVQYTEAQIMSNIDGKILGESNKAKSKATVGSQNDFKETEFDKLLRDTVMCENKDDGIKKDTPSQTLPNSVEQLLSPLNKMNLRKQDSKKLGIQGKFDSKTVETFFERNFTESNLKSRPLTVNETPSDDSLPQNEMRDVNTENVTETRHCSNKDVNIDINNSEKKDAEKSKVTLRKYFNKKIIKNANTDKLGAIANESTKLKDKEEETLVLKDKPKTLKKNSAHKTIKKDKPSIESKQRLPKHLPRKQRNDRLFDSLIEKNVSMNDHDVYKFSYDQPKDKTLLAKRRRSSAKYKNKVKDSNIIAEREDDKISKTIKNIYTKASANLSDETMRGASTVQLKDTELVKVDIADKIDEPEPASVKVSHMEIIAENVGRENQKELSANRKLRKRTKKIKDNEQDISPFKRTKNYIKKIKENMAGENETDSPTIKKNKKQIKKIKNTKKTDRQKTPPSQLATQLVETITRDNENVKDISYDIIRNEKNDSLNIIEIYNDSSDRNENEKVNELMPKENDVFDVLSSNSLTLKTVVTSSTIKALDKTYEPRNLEYEYLKHRQRDFVNDLLSVIDQENECREQKRTNASNTKAKELVGTKNLELRVSVERMSIENFEKSSHTKMAKLKTNKKVNTNKKHLAKAKSKSTPVPSVCLERLNSEKIAQILSESSDSLIRENRKSNRNSKVHPKDVTIEARVTIESSPVIENKAENYKRRKLETPARSTNSKFSKNNGGRRLQSRRESSVSDWINKVDPRPKVSLSEHIDDMKKIVLEKIDTRLDEIQRENTRNTLNMCVDIDKKLEQVFKTQCNVNTETINDLGKHLCDLLKRENHHTTERWREAFNGLHKELKSKSKNLLAEDIRIKKMFVTQLREEIENI